MARFDEIRFYRHGLPSVAAILHGKNRLKQRKINFLRDCGSLALRNGHYSDLIAPLWCAADVSAQIDRVSGECTVLPVRGASLKLMEARAGLMARVEV